VSSCTEQLYAAKKDWAHALPHAADALWAAEASGYDEVALDALRGEIQALSGLDRFKEAHEMVRRGDAAPLRYKASAAARVAFFNRVCGLFMYEARYAEAKEPCQRGLDIGRRELAPDDELNAAAINETATSVFHLGDYEGALRMYREAVAVGERALGSSHPTL